MEIFARRLHPWVLALSGLLTGSFAAGLCDAQRPGPADALAAKLEATAGRPLPAIDDLLRQAEKQQQVSKRIGRDYTYHSFDSDHELGSHGGVKKTTTKETERICTDFCITKLVAVDGKPLSADAVKRQNEAIDRVAAWSKDWREKKAAGQAPPPPPKIKDADGVSDGSPGFSGYVSKFLQVGPRLGTFSNLRRVDWKGRDTIAIDYLGNPNSKSASMLDGVFRNLAGTVWVDEQDHALVRMEGHVYQDYKIGGGLLADVHKGATLQMEWTKVNDEIWLPATFSGGGSARLLIFTRESHQIDQRWSDYRKFRASSKILPVDAVPDASQGPGASQP